jgi:hypothetical protein
MRGEVCEGAKRFGVRQRSERSCRLGRGQLAGREISRILPRASSPMNAGLSGRLEADFPADGFRESLENLLVSHKYGADFGEQDTADFRF